MKILVPFLLPIASFLAVGVLIVGLGTTFLAIGKNGTIVLGLAIIILVPLSGLIVIKMGDNGESS